jgi:hypothetical protein
MHATTPDLVHQTIRTQFTTILTNLLTWAQDESRTLTAIEQQVLPLLQSLGQAIVAGCAQLQAPSTSPPTIPCPCGQPARALRQRPATVITLLGRITIPRTYYHCAACGTGHHPLDAHLEIAAGSRSAALNDLLALLGATQDSFAQAATLLERLTLIHVSPSTVRAATHHLGATLVEHQRQQVECVPAAPPPARLYVAMDGVFAHLQAQQWREIKVGCCFETQTRPDHTRPEQVNLRALHPTYLAALTEAAPFGDLLWAEAARRGVLDAAEVVVVSDGAHWIWNLASTHFPGATQILDWYHASQYVWAAASAIWGETGAQRDGWVHQQLDRLWDGQVAQVLADLIGHQTSGADVAAAISYYTTHQGRMDYPVYRARGLQIGSGSVESACKQVVSARLKQAGMIWSAAGAEGVATVRAWLNSGRWAEAMGLRPPPQRTYRRQADSPDIVAAAPAAPVPPPAPRVSLPATVLARVRAEEAQERAVHPWKKAWSARQQHPDTSVPPGEPPRTLSA